MSNKKIQKCSACGTSEVNHKLLFISGFLEETIGRIGKVFSVNENGRFFIFFEKVLFKILVILGILRFSDDKEKALTGRSRLVWDEAQRRGIKMQQFVILGMPIEHYRALINGKYFSFESIPIPINFSYSGYKWVDDKFVLSERLRNEGVASPRAIKVSLFSSALKAFNKLDKPVIIKPRFGSRGRHTTTNINTPTELKKALRLSQMIAPVVVVEEHIFGSVYRATVVNGSLVGFFRADPPYVVGNGISSIKELIEEKNKNKNEKVDEITVNDDVHEFLGRQNLTINSILPDALKIDLSAKTGRFFGGYTREMLPEVHPKMHSIFEKASKIVDIPVAGFDLIIPDPTLDPDTQKWGIIECNSLPFIDLHYFALEGQPVDISSKIWDLWNLPKKS